MRTTMKDQLITYLEHLKNEEKSHATIIQYKRDIKCFLGSVNLERCEALTKETVIAYKEQLQQTYKPSSVNAKIAALNGFFEYLNLGELKVKQLKVQKQSYCSREKELTKNEYKRLIQTAEKESNHKLSMIIQTICGLGIRVSELAHITAEAVTQGEATIQLKGKIRTIWIGGKTRKALRNYIKKENIQSGPIFITRNGNPMDRSNIWKMMKALCAEARVDHRKVFPHNLRHLFARLFYSIDKDIARLADILGHSNINTTRIYLVSSGREHQRCMDALGLVFP